MWFGLLITLLNPSLTEYDATWVKEPEPIVYELETYEYTDEELETLDDLALSHRRGDNNGYSADDMFWLYQCIEAEEGGNNHRAKYLSACCVLNRVRLGWAVSVTEAIFSPRQFEVVRNSRIYRVKPSEDTIRACNEAIDNCEEWVIAFAMGDKHSWWCEVVEVQDGEYYYKAR